MIKLTIELPDEAAELIKSQGYDVEGYVDVHLTKPLLDAIKAQKRQKVADDAECQIESEIAIIKSAVKTDRKDYQDVTVAYGNETDEDYKEKIVTLEVDPKTRQLIGKPPKGSKIKKVVQEEQLN